jgi:hypothetical protein
VGDRPQFLDWRLKILRTNVIISSMVRAAKKAVVKAKAPKVKHIAKARKVVKGKAPVRALPVVNAAEQAKRVFNMNRDKERYALVDFQNHPHKTHFTLINMKDGKKVTIGVNFNTNVHCSCMDWRIRGKNNNLNCKHILYVVSQILGLDYSITRANRMADWIKFSSAFDRIKINFGANVPAPEKFLVPENRVLTEEDLCAVCYTDFMADAKENLVNCLKCRNMVHLDCFRVWNREAVVKGCVYCRDPDIGKHIA